MTGETREAAEERHGAQGERRRATEQPIDRPEQPRHPDLGHRVRAAEPGHRPAAERPGDRREQRGTASGSERRGEDEDAPAADDQRQDSAHVRQHLDRHESTEDERQRLEDGGADAGRGNAHGDVRIPPRQLARGERALDVVLQRIEAVRVVDVRERVVRASPVGVPAGDAKGRIGVEEHVAHEQHLIDVDALPVLANEQALLVSVQQGGQAGDAGARSQHCLVSLRVVG